MNRGAGGMIGDILDVGAGGLLVFAGLAGAVLPALPGVPLVFGGLLLAAWADGFVRVGWLTLVVLGVLTAVSFAIDFAAAALGAKRVGATKLRDRRRRARHARTGIFFGLPGLTDRAVCRCRRRRDADRTARCRKAARAGMATWVGLLFGTLVKIALVCTMLGIFVAAWFF